MGLVFSRLLWWWSDPVSEGVVMMKMCLICIIIMMKYDSLGYSFPVTLNAV